MKGLNNNEVLQIKKKYGYSMYYQPVYCDYFHRMP